MVYSSPALAPASVHGRYQPRRPPGPRGLPLVGNLLAVVPQNVSRIHIGLENIAPDPRLPQGGNWMRMVLWQYGRFDEDTVPWLRLERVEDKRLPVVRIDEQSA